MARAESRTARDVDKARLVDKRLEVPELLAALVCERSSVNMTESRLLRQIRDNAVVLAFVQFQYTRLGQYGLEDLAASQNDAFRGVTSVLTHGSV